MMDGGKNSDVKNLKPPPKKRGRKPGQLNRATILQRGNLFELARTYTDVALNTLSSICVDGESEAARVSAATALLDRGYGRPAQALEITGKGGQAIEITTRVVALDRFFGMLSGELINATPANILPAE